MVTRAFKEAANERFYAYTQATPAQREAVDNDARETEDALSEAQTQHDADKPGLMADARADILREHNMMTMRPPGVPARMTNEQVENLAGGRVEAAHTAHLEGMIEGHHERADVILGLSRDKEQAKDMDAAKVTREDQKGQAEWSLEERDAKVAAEVERIEAESLSNTNTNTHDPDSGRKL